MDVSVIGNRRAGLDAGSRLDLLVLKSLRMKTRDRNAKVQKCGSLFCILTWTVQLCKVPWSQGWVQEPGQHLWSSSQPGESCCSLLTSTTQVLRSPIP